MYKINTYIFICLWALFPFYKSYSQTGVGTKNPQAALRIDGAKDNTVTGAPTASQAANDVMVATTGQLGVGVVAPTTKVDLRSADQKGIIGVGTNTQTASAAGAGAIRYGTAGGYIEYSDGVNWIPLPLAAPTKALVNAVKTISLNITQNADIPVTGWNETIDVGGNFDNSTFTAPRDGFYVASFSITLASAVINSNTRLETIIQSNQPTDNIQAFRSVNSYPAYQATTGSVGVIINNVVAGNCSAIFNLKAGNTIKFLVWHNLGSTRAVDVSTGGINNFISISEL